MSSLPILSLWKSTSESVDVSELFAQYKKIQTLKKQRDLEKTRKNKIENRLKDLDEELDQKSTVVESLLSTHAYLSAKDMLEFLNKNWTSITSGETSKEDFDKEFFKWVSDSALKDKPDGTITLYAEMDDTGHLVLCPNKDNCSIHKSHMGMGLIRVDPREFVHE